MNNSPDTSRTIPLPRLLPWESGMTSTDIPEYIPSEPPSSLKELQRLARVKAEGEVGSFGPSLAAIALERPGEHVSAELRKYETLFGRDSLRVALDVLPMYPLLMHATIHELAKHQGTVTHAAREEEPGRIIHEFRESSDPIAQNITDRFGWEWPYFGSVDSTPQFMHAMYEYTFGRNAPVGGETLFNEKNVHTNGENRTLGEVYRRALAWLENRLNANAEGFLEYKSSIPGGIENQVWRDSWDCYFHEDGSLANRNQPIASVEVQQLVYDALIEASTIYQRIFGDKEKSLQLAARATQLRKKILEHFWVDDKGGYFALGLDRDDTGALRQLKIRTSNMGHLLRSRLLTGETYRSYREKTITQLFSKEMLNVSGIRTLATDEIRFRPGAYHNGSVWLWDTYYIAEGLRYHGYYELATHLADKIHTVINVTQKFPEYVRGDDAPSPAVNPRIVEVHDNSVDRTNRIEQPPQEVQAWSVAAEVARDYYSGIVPDRAYDARAVQFESFILSSLKQ